MSLPVTEDTPPDMLAGSMDLKVVLPSGQNVKMSIQRGTPMMDLLVQVTTAHCLNPGDYSLQAMGDKGVLPFKPSTPIGALDTFTVKIVEKKLHSRGKAPPVPQSFLNTFRLQVHLPRSQLFVLRVTPDVTLSEIMTHICTEKNLNLEKYEFRNPGNLEEVLELDKTLGYYKLQELSMVSKGNRTITGLMSSADIINVKSSKHRQNSVCDSSLSSGSFGSRSGSPVPGANVVTMPPQPPIRKKRRPAPKPPGFKDTDKKERNTGSVLISHSRESSDSSGYHEASVLSESPTHGGPPGQNSPPDTLPRRSTLPPSQSFTNLTSIQPSPRSRLTSSVSNTSLNSNGQPRKKRAPPPPPIQVPKEDKVKSSTLPISVTEERRNGSGFTTENIKLRRSEVDDEPVETSNTKVQIPVGITPSELVNETKASKDEMPASVDVDVNVPPKPKPRTIASSSGSAEMLRDSPKYQYSLVRRELPETKCEHSNGFRGSLNRWNNSVNLHQEDKNNDDYDGEQKKRLTNVETVKNCLNMGNKDASQTPESQDQGDQDSINWEYQLPPPPTDFRDTNSPNCTEFGTITITPEILENFDERKKDEEKLMVKKTEPETKAAITENQNKNHPNHHHNHHYRTGNDKKVSQNKTEVMNELTNILNVNRKCKEKSLSVSNLYINDFSTKDYKKNSLNYSRSFSTDPVSSLGNFKLTTYETKGLENNRQLSNSNEVVFNSEITYRNHKNLEKSSSMECIQTEKLANRSKIIEKNEEVLFRKPVAPVQKKLKIAKRSASSIGVNTTNSQKKLTKFNQNGETWTDDANISVLRQQFLEFLKEKKLNSDLNAKSFDVIRNILPELNGEPETKTNTNSHVKVVANQKEINSQGTAHSVEPETVNGEDKVKIVDLRVKSSLPVEEPVQNHVTVTHEGRKDQIETETMMRESKKAPEKKTETTKRYSYQGPPSINFATWGERPKTTRIIIKDEDYVTQEKVIEKKKTEVIQSPALRNGDAAVQKPQKEAKKPQITFKKPGVISHYEMFSALPKRKEISSLELVHLEDEEKKKKMEEKFERFDRIEKEESKKFSRVPVVCGVELKKEFKGVSSSMPSNSTDKTPETDVNKHRHSVSVYVNGNQDNGTKLENCKNSYNFILPKRNPNLMPVVKGFRFREDSNTTTTTTNNDNNSNNNNNTTSHVNISNYSTSNHVNINISSEKEVTKDVGGGNNYRQEKSSSSSKRQINGVSCTPPPPPPSPPSNMISMIKLKPVNCAPVKQKISGDPRDQLLEEIRNFGGLKNLKKFTVH